MPKISVIVPIYNVEAYIGDCIESLKAQAFQDFEVICVDDGSTDASALRARVAIGDDPRFRLISRENGGLSAARNTGLDAATGDFIVFVDSDDKLAPESLATMVAAQEAADADLVEFTTGLFYDDGLSEVDYEEEFPHHPSILVPVSGPELFVELNRHGWYFAPVQLRMVRRSLLEDAGLRFAEGFLHEDELFTPLVYAHAHRAVYLDEELYLRRLRAGSIMTSSKSLHNLRSYYGASQILHGWILEHGADYDNDFVDAFCRVITLLRDAVYRTVQELPPQEVEAFRDSLDMQQRIQFNLDCLIGYNHADARMREYSESAAYRLGNVAVSAARTAKRCIAGALRTQRSSRDS